MTVDPLVFFIMVGIVAFMIALAALEWSPGLAAHSRIGGGRDHRHALHHQRPDTRLADRPGGNSALVRSLQDIREAYPRFADLPSKGLARPAGRHGHWVLA